MSRLKGYKHSEETKKKIGEAHKGKKLSNNHRKRLSEAKKGRPSSALGKHWKIKNTSKMSVAKIGNTNGFKNGHKKPLNAHSFLRGAEHPNWKGGITPLRNQIRQCFQYRQWRSDVFTRDDFTCQKCGTRSGNGKAVYLEADHYPKTFSDILQEYKIKTLEESLTCEELWNINNGRTLCRTCHDKTQNGNTKLNQLT